MTVDAPPRPAPALRRSLGSGSTTPERLFRVALVLIEHPSGQIDVTVDYEATDGFRLKSAGLLRTARLLARGEVMVPASVWDGTR